MKYKRRYVIFSDIDATLLDFDTYEFKAQNFLKKIKKDKHFLILNSSKTSAEIRKIINDIKYKQPFICENGSAIYFPCNFLKLSNIRISKKVKGWDVIELAASYSEIIKLYRKLKKSLSFEIKGFSEMSLNEIIKFTNLPRDLARLAKKREYTEPFMICEEGKDFLNELENKCKEFNLSFTKGGRFYHLMFNQDKGKAASICLDILKKQTNYKLKTIAIGDSKNDEEMLKIADIPILMPKKNGCYDKEIQMKNLIYAPEAGSLGFCKILSYIIYGD